MFSLLKIANRSQLRIAQTYGRPAIKCNSTAAQNTEDFLPYDRDPAADFLNASNQKLLKSLTRLRLDKVYRKRVVLNNKIEYKFMTTEEIEAEIKSAISKAETLLQMPPVVGIQEEQHKTISVDPALQSHDTAKFVFTDITFGVPDAERTIVVRHPDGTLENARPEIRTRVNQIYFPMEGRKLRQPKLFEPEHLKSCLDRLNYEFILDRSCVQFEPYDQKFHSITQQVYLHVNESKQFDLLRSTRHFGPMTFFFAWHKIIDNLLVDIIQRDFMHNAVELISLMYRLNGITFDETILTQLDQLKQRKAENLEKNILAIGHGELQQDIEARVGKTEEDFAIDAVCFAFIEEYNKSHALKKSPIQAALQTYREKNDEKRRLFDGLQKAHGVGQ